MQNYAEMECKNEILELEPAEMGLGEAFLQKVGMDEKTTIEKPVQLPQINSNEITPKVQSPHVCNPHYTQQNLNFYTNPAQPSWAWWALLNYFLPIAIGIGIVALIWQFCVAAGPVMVEAGTAAGRAVGSIVGGLVPIAAAVMVVACVIYLAWNKMVSGGQAVGGGLREVRREEPKYNVFIDFGDNKNNNY